MRLQVAATDRRRDFYRVPDNREVFARISVEKVRLVDGLAATIMIPGAYHQSQ
jgi:hypothetical protein